MTTTVDSPDLRRAARRALLVLTSVNLFNYLDRYVLAALVEPLKAPGGLGLSDFQVGSLVPAFIVVYTLGSTLVGAVGDRWPRPRVLATGVAIWSVATAISGLAGGFLALFLARALVGVGEAAYGTIAPGLLADCFPYERRGRAFAIFFAAIPVGSALGFILGGIANEHFGWRSAFFIAGAPGVVLALLALTLPDPPRGIHDPPGSPGAAATHGAGGGWAAYRPLWGNRTYLLAVAGYAATTFAIGGLAFWMPAFLERVRHASNHDATVQFGAITVVTGLVGTFAGGVIGDRLLRRTRHAYLWLSGVTTLAGVPFVAVALTAPSPSVYLPAMFVGELLLFASTGPVNSAIVNLVEPRHRTAAVALSILGIHLLGDVPSPPLIGWISDATSLGTAVLVVPVAIAAGGAIWTWAAWSAGRRDRGAASA